MMCLFFIIMRTCSSCPYICRNHHSLHFTFLTVDIRSFLMKDKVPFIQYWHHRLDHYKDQFWIGLYYSDIADYCGCAMLILMCRRLRNLAVFIIRSLFRQYWLSQEVINMQWSCQCIVPSIPAFTRYHQYEIKLCQRIRSPILAITTDLQHGMILCVSGISPDIHGYTTAGIEYTW